MCHSRDWRQINTMFGAAFVVSSCLFKVEMTRLKSEQEMCRSSFHQVASSSYHSVCRTIPQIIIFMAGNNLLWKYLG